MRAAGLPVPSKPWNGRRATSESSGVSSRDLARSLDRSPNRLPAHPTEPAVLSNIISSLDTLAPLRDIQSPEQSSDSASRRSRPLSSSDGGTIASAASPRPSNTSGFGIDYGHHFKLEEEGIDGIEEDEGADDAALPPTIRTARPPSGLSQYIAPRTPAYAGNALLRLIPDSPRSSLTISAADRQAASKNKLSAESWVRRGSAADVLTETTRGRANSNTLRRGSLQELVMRDEASPSPSPARAIDAFATSPSEQVLPSRPTTSSSSKGRLYLRDSTINEDWPLANPLITKPSPDVSVEDAGANVSSPPDGHPVQTLAPPSRSSNPISDSIPERTSSLRQPSVSPAPSKRKKKSRRQTPASGAAEPKPYKPSKQIPESKWADLGEDDETVKRIRQLKEQRKSRLQFLGAVDSLSTSPSLSPTPEHQDAAPISNLTASPSPISPDLAPPSDYPGVTGSFNNGVYRPSGASGPHSPVSPTWDSKTSPLAPIHPGGPLKPVLPATPKRSLDSPMSRSRYGIRADAVRTPSREDLESSPSQRAAGSQTHSPPPMPSFNVRPRSKKGRKSISEKHPDLPSDFDRRRSRRKSVGDPRLARAWEEGMDQARRDSIDTAVLNYLEAPRLSRRVRHSVTGRVITFSEVGDPDGAAVFVCVGMGLTRFITAFYDELAATLRLRLITIDRPGVGGSEAYPSTDKSGPLSWPGDLLIICQELGITRFSLLAHSAGAVYALATALILPHMINGKVHLLAPWIPPSQLEVISHPTASASTPPAGALPRSQRLLRALPTPLLKAANIGGSSASLRPPNKRKVTNQRPIPQFGVEPDSPDGESAASSDERPDFTRRESLMLMDRYMPATNPTENFSVAEKDVADMEPALHRSSLVLSATATPTDPSFTYAAKALNAAEHTARERQGEYTSRLTESTWTLATRDSHPTVDLVICLERNRDVGFRYTDVHRDVVIHHGAEDKRVPLRNVKWVAGQMNRRANHRNSVADHVPPESRDGWADAATHGSCEVRVLSNEGHGLMANPSIMSDVLTEIAAYWVGQDRGRIM